MNSKDYIASIPDFLREGVLFRDITSLMTGGKTSKEACGKMIDSVRSMKADATAGPEFHGFIFGCSAACEPGIGFVPARKPGKLSRETADVSCDLGHGSNELHVHRDDIKGGQRVLIVDDLLATGGTVDATIQTVQELDGEATDCVLLIEPAGSKDREYLEGFNVFSLMSYEQ